MRQRWQNPNEMHERLLNRPTLDALSKFGQLARCQSMWAIYLALGNARNRREALGETTVESFLVHARLH